MFQGYVDERSTRHVAGWVRDLDDPAARVAFEVVLVTPGRGVRVLRVGVAERFSEVLVQVGVGDGRHAFRVEYPELSEEERDRVFVRPAAGAPFLELAPGLVTAMRGTMPPRFQGYVDERSIGHVAGWVRDLGDESARFEVEIVGAGGAVLGRARADVPSAVLREIGVGAGDYAFRHEFARKLKLAEAEAVFVRPAGSAHVLELAPALRTEFPLISRIEVPPEIESAAFESLLRLAPYVADGGIRLAGLGAENLALIGLVPEDDLHRVSVAVDLSARIAPIWFERVAKIGVHSLVIGVPGWEGASPFFREQFAALAGAVRRATKYYGAVPGLRYRFEVAAASLAEAPAIVSRLVAEGVAAHVRVGRGADLIDAQWDWLCGQMAPFPEALVTTRAEAGLVLRVDAAGVVRAGEVVLGPVLAMDSPVDEVVAVAG